MEFKVGDHVRFISRVGRACIRPIKKGDKGIILNFVSCSMVRVWFPGSDKRFCDDTGAEWHLNVQNWLLFRDSIEHVEE